MYHFKVKATARMQRSARSGRHDPGRQDADPGPQQALTARGAVTDRSIDGHVPALETRGLTIRFGGHVAVNAVSVPFQPRHAHGYRRTERRRQDHLLQPDLGPAARSAGQVLVDGRGHHARLPASARHTPRIGTRIPAHQSVSATDRARKRAPRGAEPRRCGLVACFDRGTRGAILSRRPKHVLERVRLADKRHVRAGGSVAWRSAQARSRASHRDGAEGLHVRRADRRHERRRSADGPRTHPATSSSAATPLSCWSSTRWTWCARSPTASSCCTTAPSSPTATRRTVIASPIVQEAYLGVEVAPWLSACSDARGRAHAYRPLSYPARRRFRDPARAI